MSADRDGIHAHWRHLDAAERTSGLTSTVRTVLDCATALPFDEALAVADSALRDGDVTKAQLVAAAAQLRGPGSARARRVVALADHRAANPFESALRALAMEFSELTFEPQLRIWDPVCGRLSTWATRCTGSSWRRRGSPTTAHAKDLVRDCHRYTELTVWGWAVLRFSWEDVMLRPERVRWAIGALLEQRAGRPVPAPPS